MATIKRIFLSSLIVIAILAPVVHAHFFKASKANMTALTARLIPMFQKTKTVCFGRFMIDVPEAATVVWGRSDVPLSIHVYPNGADEIWLQAQKFIDELNSKKAINHDGAPLLISVNEVSNPTGRLVIGYENFQSINGLKINGYFQLSKDGVLIDSRPMREDKDETLKLINSIAGRLRRRAETEIPKEPGNCIEHAFLPDRAGPEKDPYGELIDIGFRLKEFPDVHISVSVNPSNPHYSESDSLAWQLARIEKDQRAQDPNHPLLKTKYLRRGARQISDWGDGFEGLSRTPEQADIHSIHDFAMDFRGVPADPLKPHAVILMQTGVADDLAGATKASLTDDEAVAVWDTITSTIRVRPTSSATADRTSELADRPLGELAVTGRICPQSGWWEPNEIGDKSRREYLKAGERMPYLTVTGEPSIWQKLKGERPSYRTATTWKLVAYDNEPAKTNPATGAPTVALTSPNSATAGDTGSDTLAGNQNDQSPPKKG